MQGKLSRKFKVTGIPTLVIINSETGKLITADGRAVVTDDPDGKDFPWYPETFLDIMKKGELLADNKGKKTQWDEVEGGTVGVYFSAHWVRNLI